MTGKLDVYKCKACGNIVQLLEAGEGELYCCGVPMIKMIENTVEAAEEKHIPIINKTYNEFKVKVGSIPHPMETDHYIQWIELITPNEAYLRFMNPEDSPEASFNTSSNKEVYARAYCNIHGLWKS